MKKCCKCGVSKPLTEYYANKRAKDGKRYDCKECHNAHLKAYRDDPSSGHREVRRTWAANNRDRLREQERLFREANRELKRVNENRRRARKQSLPDTLTIEQTEELLERFEGKCAVCENDAEHLDHFIPLATGHGGTTLGNTVPLCASHNVSKHARNPFVWAATLSECERERFDSLVSYLTVINGIAAVEDYKAHVYQCFK